VQTTDVEEHPVTISDVLSSDIRVLKDGEFQLLSEIIATESRWPSRKWTMRFPGIGTTRSLETAPLLSLSRLSEQGIDCRLYASRPAGGPAPHLKVAVGLFVSEEVFARGLEVDSRWVGARIQVLTREERVIYEADVPLKTLSSSGKEWTNVAELRVDASLKDAEKVRVSFDAGPFGGWKELLSSVQ
jgi:hypothetical protein